MFSFVIGAVHQSIVNNDNANTADTANIANATATATIINANPDPYDGGSGTLALYDTLTQSGNWSNGSNPSFGESCQFKSDGYHITELKNYHTYNCDTSTSVNNFVFEVKMSIIRGDCGGMALSYNSSTGTGYIFYVCSDGSYQFYRYSGSSASDASILGSGSNSGITSGQNTIAVVANGGTFTLYLNNTQLGNSITDNTDTQGEIGLLSSDTTNATEVVYNNARLWTL